MTCKKPLPRFLLGALYRGRTVSKLQRILSGRKSLLYFRKGGSTFLSILTELFLKLLRQSLKKFTLLNHAPLFPGSLLHSLSFPPPQTQQKTSWQEINLPAQTTFFQSFSFSTASTATTLNVWFPLHPVKAWTRNKDTSFAQTSFYTHHKIFPSVYQTLTTPRPQFLLPRKCKGHFSGSDSVTIAELHTAAFVRGRLRLNGKTIVLLLSLQALQFMKSRSENSSREGGLGREQKQSCCRGLTISYQHLGVFVQAFDQEQKALFRVFCSQE